MKFLHMWHVCDVKISKHMQNLCYFAKKKSVFAIHAILSRNLSCRDLRTFVWRKNYLKIALVEKNCKYEVWVTLQIAGTNSATLHSNHLPNWTPVGPKRRGGKSLEKMPLFIVFEKKDFFVRFVYIVV